MKKKQVPAAQRDDVRLLVVMLLVVRVSAMKLVRTGRQALLSGLNGLTVVGVSFCFTHIGRGSRNGRVEGDSCGKGEA
jgi:hypothetical protein